MLRQTPKSYRVSNWHPTINLYPKFLQKNSPSWAQPAERTLFSILVVIFTTWFNQSRNFSYLWFPKNTGTSQIFRSSFLFNLSGPWKTLKRIWSSYLYVRCRFLIQLTVESLSSHLQKYFMTINLITKNRNKHLQCHYIIMF